jgi:hypothetical protein
MNAEVGKTTTTTYLLSEDPEITMATAPDMAGIKELKSNQKGGQEDN